MPSDSLTLEEQAAIKGSLRAIAYGPFLDEDEFHTLIGLTREELRKIADAYPDVDEYDMGAGECDDSRLAINNSVLNLIEFGRGMKEEWGKYLAVDPMRLQEIFEKWKK